MTPSTSDTSNAGKHRGPAPDPSASTLAANSASCAECGQNLDDPTVETCPSCESDFLEHHHVSATPLGYDDDDDHHIAAGFGLPERWVYDAADPRPDLDL